MKQLRIGIDVHSVGADTGGNETYSRELVKALASESTGKKFFLYYTSPGAPLNFRVNGNFTLKRLSPAYPLLRIPVVFPWRIRKDELDVLHAQYTSPPFVTCKVIVTIHDIAYEHFPQFFPLHQRAWLKSLIRISARKADHIITASEYSKRDIVRTYGIAEEKVTVTYYASSDEFFPTDKEFAKGILARKYGIEGNFILYLGRLQGRKNLVRLVAAYARFRKSGCQHKLVLAGKQDSLSQAVRSQIQLLKLENEVLLPGYVPRNDMPAFYNAADVFVYPSLYEGFGLPVVEAMACGIPVITSRSSSLEEIAGSAALLVDPLDEASIEGALERVLENGELRAQLSHAGLARSRDFDFKNTARRTIAVYESVAGRN
jgi:glycosyltransferase involved in cell wall biosynthesis